MSSPKVRHFLNNLCERSDTRYLEIGCWRGSTLISALYRNHLSVQQAIAIDNFSEFQPDTAAGPVNVNPLIDLLDPNDRHHFLHAGTPQEEFIEKTDLFLQPRPAEFQFYDADCFSPDLLDRLRTRYADARINTYLYDGAHDCESQRRAFCEFDFILDQQFIALVDDWNAPGVKEGTFQAFRELGYQVIKQWELPARFNGDMHNWWNGLYVGVIHKSRC